MAPHPIPTRAQLFLAALGEQALTHRETARLSVEAVATTTGMEPETIAEFERGQRDLKLSELQKLADAIGASVFELLDVAGTELGLSLDEPPR